MLEIKSRLVMVFKHEHRKIMVYQPQLFQAKTNNETIQNI